MREERAKFIAVLAHIVREYYAQGFVLTVRQLFYQCVARNILHNDMRSYKKVVRDCKDGRYLGVIPWAAIVDNVRMIDDPPSWDTPESFVDSAVDAFFVDRWQDQDTRVEVWTEKDAAVSVLHPVAEKWRVPFQVNRGSCSATFIKNAADRLDDRDEETMILYFGDHDPMGLDMIRDVEDRLNYFGVYPIVVPVAITLDQAQSGGYPPNYVKESDSTMRKYVEETGMEECWELDAIPPDELQEICDTAILDAFTDYPAYNDRVTEEEEGRKAIREMIGSNDD